MKPAVRRSPPPHEVRLIGGQWKRRKLPVIDAPGLRPTPDRVRETLFNWIANIAGNDLSGWRCLDAFAGSGALGFEAASRGADEVVLLERDPALVRCLREVKERLDAAAVRIEAADALVWLSRCAPGRFELVFIDPPFDSDLVPLALARAAQVVVPGGWLYLEGAQPVAAQMLASLGLSEYRSSRAGAVHFQLVQRVPSTP